MEDSHLEKLWEGNQPLKNLKWMNLSNSKFLKVLPDLSTAINLCELQLEGCSSLVELPSFGKAIHLRELNLTNCLNLMQLPWSIGNLVNLEELDLSLCKSLRELPSCMKSLRRLSKLGLKGCSKLEVCLTNINLESLKELDLSDCSLVYIDDLKPNGIVPLLSESELSSCETQELSPLIKRISRLRKLVLSRMQNLVSLPQLPYSIEELVAMNCESLERLDCSFLNPNICLNFAKCYKLNEEARDLIIHTRTNKYVVLPGGEVPSCFPYRASGSSLTVKLNQNPLCTSTKFRACIILAGKEEYGSESFTDVKVNCSIKSKQNALSTLQRKEIYLALPDHLYLFEVEAMEVTTTELVFEFELVFLRETMEIKECGIFELDKESIRRMTVHGPAELVCEDENRRQLHRD